MSRLLEIHEQISGNAAALARLEQSISKHPDAYGLTINRRSLQKRQRELEAEFAEAAREAAVDICRYRMFSDEGEPNALAATQGIADFQLLLSIVHDALKHGPRKVNKPSPDALHETEFKLGYVFQGSVGFTLTRPSERPLLPEGSIDATMAAVFQLVQSTTQEQVTNASRSLGPAVIRSLYKWATDHLNHQMGVDIQLLRGQATKAKVFIQQKEIRILRDIVELTSENIQDEIDVTGIYVGIDVQDKSVHILMQDEPDIRAKFGPDFKPPALPPPIGCKAKLRKETKIHLATEKEDVKYTILRMGVGAV